MESRDDEVEVCRVDALDALLDDVVAVLVFDALQDVALQLGDDDLLLIPGNALQGLLDHPTAVHLQSQWLHLSSKLIEERRKDNRLDSFLSDDPLKLWLPL